MSLGDKKTFELISELKKNFIENFNAEDKETLRVVEEYLSDKIKILSTCES